MSFPALCVSPDTRSHAALELAIRRAIHHLPVTLGGELLGISCACELWLAPANAAVGRHMSAHVPPVTPTLPVHRAAALMDERRSDSLLVRADCGGLGIVTRGDLYRAGAFGEAERSRCTSCGATRHLVGDVDWMRFCVTCLQRPGPDDLHYVDLGESG